MQEAKCGGAVASFFMHLWMSEDSPSYILGAQCDLLSSENSRHLLPVPIKTHRQTKSVFTSSSGTVPFSFCVQFYHTVTLIPPLFSSTIFLWCDNQYQALYFAILESKVFFREWRVIWVPALGFQRQSSLLLMSWAGRLTPLINFEILILCPSTQGKKKKICIAVSGWTCKNSVRWGVLQVNFCIHIYV